MSMKFKDAKNSKEFDIVPYKKGFVATSTVESKEIQEFFQFREIQKITHYPDTGVEIIMVNGNVRVFYNGDSGASENLFKTLNTTMIKWMDSNTN